MCQNKKFKWCHEIIITNCNIIVSLSTRSISTSYYSSAQNNIFNIMGTANGKPELREEDVQALMRTSNKTEAQVKDSFNRFLEDHPTGEIDQEGFKDLMREALPAKDAK